MILSDSEAAMGEDVERIKASHLAIFGPRDPPLAFWHVVQRFRLEIDGLEAP
ncbi:MAG: hypothetical protein L7W43_12505 [Rubripirellula sp.]|nr:hypothetical protein [Rubripirellula sp.]